MKKILPVVALLGLVSLTAPVSAQTQTLPTEIPASVGLVVGWNSFTPSYCYTFNFGPETIVKLETTNGVVLQSNTSASASTMTSICASGKRFSVHSSDGVKWEGIFMSATPGG